MQIKAITAALIVAAANVAAPRFAQAQDVQPAYYDVFTGTVGVAAISTVTPSQTGAQVYKTTLACDDVPITITYGGSGTNSTGGVQLYAFPQGRLLVLGVTVEDFHFAPTATNGFAGTDGGDFSLGTASATGATLATTEVDLCPSTSIDPITNATDSALAASAQFDGTTTAKAIYANMLVDADDITDDAPGTFDATIKVTWINLGDY